MNTRQNTINVKKLTYLAMLSALVVLLQLVFAPMIGAASGGVLSPALVLIPIVLGVSTCGIGAGAWLGGIFSLIVMFDPTTVPFFEYSPALTILLVFAKGVGSGVVAGLIYKLVSKKNKYVAVILAALSAPIVNTGIFVIGCLLFFRALTGVGIYTVFISVNFAVELAVNVVLVPAIYHLLEVTKILERK